MEWTKVLYNGLETNVEVTRCGKVKRVIVDWMKIKSKSNEIDLNKLKLNQKLYKTISVQIKGLKPKGILIHQLIASAFLNYKFEGHNLVVDHIDNNPLNNNVNNLQVISQRENCSRLKSLKSGLPTGVSYSKKRNKYISQIQINKRIVYLGGYNTIEEASNAYQLKLKSLSIND